MSAVHAFVSTKGEKVADLARYALTCADAPLSGDNQRFAQRELESSIQHMLENYLMEFAHIYMAEHERHTDMLMKALNDYVNTSIDMIMIQANG